MLFATNHMVLLPLCRLFVCSLVCRVTQTINTLIYFLTRLYYSLPGGAQEARTQPLQLRHHCSWVHAAEGLIWPLACSSGQGVVERPDMCFLSVITGGRWWLLSAQGSG